MTPRHLVPALTALVLLSGCGVFRGNCHEPGAYTKAQSIPLLNIPPGLEAPDTRGALRIPELHEPERPRGPGDACLESPPKISAPQKPVPRPQA